MEDSIKQAYGLLKDRGNNLYVQSCLVQSECLQSSFEAIRVKLVQQLVGTEDLGRQKLYEV